VWSLRNAGMWSDSNGVNLLDGGAPFYDTYACADGRFVAVGALEPVFWQHLIERLGIGPDEFPHRDDPACWPALRERLTAIFATRSRDGWAELFAGTDACVTPVLAWGEAIAHPHVAGRGTLTTVDGVVQPAPAPRFSRTPLGSPSSPPTPGADTAQVFA